MFDAYAYPVLLSPSLSMDKMDLLITGLLKKYSIHDLYIPKDIILIIKNMCGDDLQENIHLIGTTIRKHYFISIADILPN